MLADATDRPLRLRVAPGQAADSPQALGLLQGLRARAVLADRACDSNALRAAIAGMGAAAVIPSTRSRKRPIPHDPGAYRLRNRVERCLGRMKHSRRPATRYERRTIHSLGVLYLAAIMEWLT